MADDPRSDLKGTSYELFMLLFSLLALANVGIVLIGGPASVAGQVALVIEIATTPLFLFDFLYRLATSPSRRGYVVRRWGWADLISVVPLLRLFRLPRVVTTIREARAVGLERLTDDLYVGRASATFLLTVFAVIVVVEFAGIAEFYVEQGVRRRQHRVRGGRDLVGPGHDHDRRLRRPVPGRRGRTHRGRVPPVRRHRPVLGVDRLHRQRVPRPGPAAPTRARRAQSPAAELAQLVDLLKEQERQAGAIRAKMHDLERALLAAKLIEPGPDERLVQPGRPLGRLRCRGAARLARRRSGPVPPLGARRPRGRRAASGRSGPRR